jgi:hypothetical protein
VLIVPSARGMPWSNIIMSCWIMPSHFGSGYFRSRRDSPCPADPALRDVGARAFSPVSSLFQSAKRIVRSSARRAAEDARQLHHERGAEPSSFARLPPAVAVHVSADDVHLLGLRRATFVQKTLRAGPLASAVGVQRAELRSAALRNPC